MKEKLKKFINKYNNMHEAAKASLWFVLCGFIQKGISVITSPIFARLLSKSEYGQYNTFMSWMNIIAVFVTLRFSYSAYMRGLVKYEEDRDRYTSSLLGLTSVIMAIFGVAYLVFRRPINAFLQLTTPMVCAMFVMMAMATSFEFWSARQRVDFKYKRLVIITLLMAIANPVAGIIVVYLSKYKIEARIFEIAIVETICYGPLLLLQLKKGKKFFVKEYWKFALLFSLPLIPHYLSQSILSQSDRVMIQKMVGDTEAGVYSLAYNVSTILIILNTSLGNTYGPWLFKAIKADKLENTKSVSNIMVVIVALFNLALIAFTPEAVLLFGSRKYYEAIWVMPPVTMGVFFMFLYSLFAYVEMYYSKTKYVLVASLTGAVLNLGLNYLLIPKYGYIAAAYTTIACYIVSSFMHFLFMRYICKKELAGYKLYDMRFIILCAIAFCGIGAGFMFTYNYPVVRYSIIGVALLLCIIFYKKIIAAFKQVMSIRKK